jgi:hypothetical protein
VISDLWVGAAATLAGAALGGAISYILSRQQIRESRAQRAEEERRDERRRSVDRRFEAYANFMTHARRYRNAIRPYRYKSAPGMPVHEIDSLAFAADAASSLVFLVTESKPTHEACRGAVRAIRDTADVMHELESDPDGAPWRKLSEDMASALRKFQTAARAELHVGGVERQGPADRQPAEPHETSPLPESRGSRALPD